IFSRFFPVTTHSVVFPIVAPGGKRLAIDGAGCGRVAAFFACARAGVEEPRIAATPRNQTAFGIGARRMVHLCRRSRDIRDGPPGARTRTIGPGILLLPSAEF